MIRRAFLACSAALLLAGCGTFTPWWPYGVEPVPESYLHRVPPMPVKIVPEPDIDAACQRIFPDADVLFNGCAEVTTQLCTAHIPEIGPRFSSGKVDAIKTHEVQGHCGLLLHDFSGRGWYTADGQEVK